VSWFSSLFQAGTGFYGDSFPPIISTIEDFGWSLLPQFPGYIRPSTGSSYEPLIVPTPTVVIAEVPVANGNGGGGIEAETTWVPEVLPGYEPARRVEVPRAVVVVEGVSTEVEQHPEGDYVAGDIFAPGRAWGVQPHDLDTAANVEEEMALGDILDWGLTTLAGQQPWQTFGPQGPSQQAYMGFAAPNVSAPSGIPGQPTTITGYANGAAVYKNGDCGNRRYVTLDRETGKISCKRRRRRRLLTNRDLADLASLKTITGGGAALNAAVIRAVR